MTVYGFGSYCAMMRSSTSGFAHAWTTPRSNRCPASRSTCLVLRLLVPVVLAACGSCTSLDGNPDDTGRVLPGLQAIFSEDPDDPLSVLLTSSSGDEYTIFARHDADNRPVQLLQVHTRMADGTVVVGYADERSRPIRFETPDETATVIYNGDRTRLLYTATDGQETVIDADVTETHGLPRRVRMGVGVVGDDTEPVLRTLGPGAPGSRIANKPNDRFGICRLLDPYFEIVGHLFACSEDDPPPFCGGVLADGVLAPVGICDTTVDLTVADEFNPALDAEPRPIALDVVATAFLDPTDTGTVVQLAATGLSESLPGTYLWEVLAGPAAPQIPDGQTTQVVLARSGAYRVQVTFVDADGLTATAQIPITIEPIAPVAEAGQDQAALAGQAVVFDAGDSFDSDGRIVLYEWDFGDGVIESGFRVSHAFSRSGTAVITLTVTDNDGQTASDTITVNVIDAPGFILTIQVLGGGTTTPPAGQTSVSPNTVVQILATPADGWTFGHYEGDASGTNPTATVFLSRDLTVVAVFELLEDVEVAAATLSTVASPSDGGSVVLIPAGNRYALGTVVGLLAVPNPGFVFSNYSGGASGSNPVTSVVMNGDLAVVAEFTASETGMTTTITQQPASTSVPCPGIDAFFNIAASGTILGFTWQRDCEPDGTFEETIVAGPDFEITSTANSSTLRVIAADTSDECNYRCLVIGSDGVVASNVVSFTITGGAREFTVQPTPPAQSVCPGVDVVYTVTAVGVGGLSYQWQQDGVDRLGETTDTLALNNVDAGDSGSYTCDVTDDCGTMTSDPAVLNVATLQFEAGTVVANEVGVDVGPLGNTYCNPVVVCTIQYDNNGNPIVPRVSAVTATGFRVRLQNPSGAGVVADTVHYLVMEEGVWTLDGVNFEAQRYTSTVTDVSPTFNGQSQTYGQVYTNPVVLGQVMSENDADWSVFWSRGSTQQVPPDPGALSTGKHVAQDTDTTRNDEDIGFIVFESGHATLGGVEFEAALGPDTIRGTDNGPPFPYAFSTAFAGAAPDVLITTQAAMDGSDGAWSYSFGPVPATQTTLSLTVDEDQIGDGERSHTTEQVGYVVFQSPFVYPP